jgi:hypothetical protein
MLQRFTLGEAADSAAGSQTHPHWISVTHSQASSPAGERQDELVIPYVAGPRRGGGSDAVPGSSIFLLNAASGW